MMYLNDVSDESLNKYLMKKSSYLILDSRNNISHTSCNHEQNNNSTVFVLRFQSSSLDHGLADSGGQQLPAATSLPPAPSPQCVTPSSTALSNDVSQYTPPTSQMVTYILFLHVLPCVLVQTGTTLSLICMFAILV